MIFFRDVISLLARVFILLIDTATQKEVPMKNIWKKLSVQFLRYAIELLHVKPLSTQRLASFLIHLCLSCLFGYNLLPFANFLKLTKTYKFMWFYNSDINKRYIWEFRPVKVIMNIVWHWKWATYINLFIWRKNHSAWFVSKCQPP